MSKIKFLNYEETPSVEGQRGIAAVILLDEVVLRFKVINRKDGNGYFIVPGTVKGNPDGEKQTWHDAFTLERNSVKEEILTMIRDEIRDRTAKHPFPSSMEKPTSMDEVCPF